MDIGDPVRLEETRVKGAIKTDFILSAEIMTIILANIEDGTFWFEAATLALAGVAVTVAVYGSVALIGQDGRRRRVACQQRQAAGNQEPGRWDWSGACPCF